MATTCGVVHIHSAPSALCPHVEWAVGGVFATPVQMEWRPQPAERSTYRSEYAWSGPVGSSARLASALKGWQRLRFEVTEEPTVTSEGVRYSYTPSLGIFHAMTGQHGDIQVGEDHLRRALRADARGSRPLADALHDLLGTRWDDELEAFRQASEGAPVRWLHQVV